MRSLTRTFTTNAALAVLSLGLTLTAANAADMSIKPPAPGAKAQPMPPDDPAKVAAAREFMIVYRPKLNPANLPKMLDKAMPGMIARAKEEDPKLDVAKFEKEKRQHIMEGTVRRLDTQARVVSHYFTLQDLKDLKAFFGSPLGQKFTAAGVPIGKELMMQKRARLEREAAMAEAAEAEAAAASKKHAPPPAKKK